MTSPNFPINLEDIKAKIVYNNVCSEKYILGSLKITPVSLSHPNDGIGYKIAENGKRGFASQPEFTGVSVAI